ncbi:MAG: DUF3775 domain-containing protein [Hyphomonadaceae bacterium]|nr:DUF3775 domain-containing protein [Hyphomonadaceae bacterium]
MSDKLNGAARHHVDVSLERLAEIVLLARQRDSDTRSMADGDGAESKSVEMAPRRRDEKVMHELREAISALPRDEQVVLIALAWIGRGDFGSHEFDEALTRAFDRRDGLPADYLLSLPMLGDVLELGVKSCGAELDGYSASNSARPNGALQ